jgi:DNA-binding response OmpR family regulator
MAISGMPLANEMHSMARLLGANAILKKPFPGKELLKAVENALKTRCL